MVVPIFPPLPPPPRPPHPLTPSGKSHTIVHVCGSYIYVLRLLYSLFCTLQPHDYSVTTDLYFLFPSPFSPILLTTLPCSKREGIPRVGETVWVRLMESQIWHSLACSVGEVSEKEQWPLPALLSRTKLPPALTPMPDPSIPCCMSLVPFKLLPQCRSSERLRTSKSVCGPFKRNCLGF